MGGGVREGKWRWGKRRKVEGGVGDGNKREDSGYRYTADGAHLNVHCVVTSSYILRGKAYQIMKKVWFSALTRLLKSTSLWLL